MRAKEFTINIPINIKINGSGDPEISVTPDDEENDTGDFLPPLQTKMEILKKSAGMSNVFDDEDSNPIDSKGAKNILNQVGEEDDAPFGE